MRHALAYAFTAIGCFVVVCTAFATPHQAMKCGWNDGFQHMCGQPDGGGGTYGADFVLDGYWSCKQGSSTDSCSDNPKVVCGYVKFYDDGCDHASTGRTDSKCVDCVH
jgi:hypothetical protein